MTLTRKLALALCLAFSFITLSSNAQVDSTTGNLINYGNTPTDTTSKWNNGVYVNQICFQAGQPGNCGPNPSIRPGGNINFSYGTTDLNQIVNINKALEAGGNGVQLSGFNFGFTAKNGNGWDDGRQDYLAAYVKLYNSGGGLAATYDYTSQTNRRYNWTNFNFSETFASTIAASNYSNAQVGFVGRDNNFWAGNYGPEIFNVSFSLKYRVDPCATNPAYSPSCSGFNNVITSNNILPHPDTWGTSMNQIVAINTALKNGGIGATIHGFNYGFDYTIGQSWSGCTATNQDGSCSWYMNIPAQVSATAQLTNSNNQSLYSKNHTLTGDGTSGSVSGQYLLPSSLNQTSLGNVRLYGNASGTGSSIGNFSANLIYTADPCVSNPLYNTSCSGYAVAYAKNMLLGSTVASASGAIVSSGGSSNSMSSNAGQVDQSQGNTQPDQTQQSQQPQQTQQQSSPSPQQESNQNPSVAQDNPSQPSPQQAGPASTGPQPAGGPPQTATASATQQNAGPSAGGSAGPSKLAMSVVKTAQANDKATQASAVQNAAKTLEAATQSSQASSNLAISLNQDMSANSATAAATFASQQTQASQQTATQTSQGNQQTTQTNTQTQQASRSGPQMQQQQDSQQVLLQSTSIAQVQAPQQQEQQQTQTQTSTSVVKLLQPQQEDSQQTQGQSSIIVQYQQPKQQEQQVQPQTSTSIVQLMPPQQQEQQASNQTTAGMMPTTQPVYTPPVQQVDTQSTQVTILKPPTPAVIEVQQQSSSGTGITVSRNLFAYNPLISSNSSNMSAPLPTPQPMYQPRLDTRQGEVDIPQFQIASFGGAGRAGNPLSEIMMQQRFELMQTSIAQPGSSVNRNVLPNELAGGVDIASIASVPTGFNAYSFVLKDASFYEPKEVYKNQRTVDNERVLRGLTRGSDSLHQQMVDQQYKLGN